MAAFVIIGCATDRRGPGTEEDIAGYEMLRTDLDADRSVLTEGLAQDFATAGDTLFWITSEGGAPLLRSLDDDTQQTTDYSLRPYLVGPSMPEPFDTVNYEVSESIVVSMNELDGANAYSIGAPDGWLGKLVLPAPPMGERWWTYAAGGGQLYVAILGSDVRHHLQRWSPGDASATEVLVLEDLIGSSAIDELWALHVEGSTLLFIESGRLWVAGLGDPSARSAQNTSEVLDAALDPLGRVVYSDDGEVWRYDPSRDARENLSDAIRGNAYRLNDTFAESHLPGPDAEWCVHGETLIYEANDGIFAYHSAEDRIEPLLLNARDNSVVYRHPTVLDDGRVFVVGLASTTGAIGADGPTYALSRLIGG